MRLTPPIPSDRIRIEPKGLIHNVIGGGKTCRIVQQGAPDSRLRLSGEHVVRGRSQRLGDDWITKDQFVTPCVEGMGDHPCAMMDRWTPRDVYAR